MNELIDSTLEMFRGEGYAEAPRSTDVLALVQALADDLVEQGHAVSVDGMPAIATVQPAALRRALANLLSNAVRYGERAAVRVLRDETGLTLLVDDDGPGIPQAQMDAVFEPFYRVESSRSRGTGGAGLGLYIARDLVRRQGGRLALANRAEGGLRAVVFLPRS
jgi:protein-histidine pros-kinase